MAVFIDSIEDEQLFRAYTVYRDAVRTVMGQHVYRRLREALAAYAALDTALATTLADPDLLVYHASLMGPIAPYIARLRADAENIVATMEAIEAVAHGTFGIPIPQPTPLFRVEQGEA